MFRTILTATAIALAAPTFAQEAAYQTSTEGDFADVIAFIEEAIVAEGLVIDYRGHLGDMLARTGADVGATSPYADAEYLVFCSAKLTHAAVAADPANIAICPYTVFAYALASDPETIEVGYRHPVGAGSLESGAAMAEIDALLRRIVDASVE